MNKERILKERTYLMTLSLLPPDTIYRVKKLSNFPYFGDPKGMEFIIYFYPYPSDPTPLIKKAYFELLKKKENSKFLYPFLYKHLITMSLNMTHVLRRP